MIYVRDVISYLIESAIAHDADGIKESAAFCSYCPLQDLKPDSITWARHAEDVPVEKLNKMERMLLIAERGSTLTGNRFPVIYAENAHRTFFRIIGRFFAELDYECKAGFVAPTATVLTDELGEDVYVGYNTFIDRDVKIADHVRIYNNVTI